MSDFRDVPAAQRFEQQFKADDGREYAVWANYGVQDDRCVILHVEAATALRGSGAASEFMHNLADHARAACIRLTPRCSYAVAWFRRHPDQGDVLA